MEKFNSYLKSKEQEMGMAKLYGRVKVFNELHHLATTLDTEVVKNPEILPILAKVIIDHDNEIGSFSNGKQAKFQHQAFSKSRSLDNISLPKSPTKSPSGGNKLPPIYLRNSSTSFMYNRNGKLTNHINYLSNSVSSSSSQAASSPRSSASSTKLSTIYHHRYPTPHRNSSTSTSNESNNFILSDLNTILKHTMNNLIKQRNNQSPAVNSLLEMTDGRQVENFVASKPDDGMTSASSVANSHGGHGHHGNGHGHHGGHHGGGLDITSVFYAAAMEKTGSYRVTAKINNEPIMPKIVKAPKPKKASSLAIIREESRVSSNVSKKSSKNGLKKQSAIQGEGLRKLGKPPAIKVAH